ncbi:hypothetical protein RCG23_10995 [Neobacillus sp. PS3-34]|uniref:hypothetical protein n=1 Tax=Neobacillus sp. PS3-34 TaxID=3070678 RepID=UPI0027DFE4CA|nr:hypothetical protein [Neobacillus sp. PS3-34]WML50263.1 hypothetical protein RCG23_10995 [Neobacillus sp. PS3-34]
MNRYLISVLGAVIGAATTGIWLGVDLLTPEPIGDYLLFSLMGISNVVIGWQVGRLVGKSREVSQTKATAKGMSPYSN